MPSLSPLLPKISRATRFLAPALMLTALAALPAPASAQGGIADFFGSLFAPRRAPQPKPIEVRAPRRHKPHHIVTTPSGGAPAAASAPAAEAKPAAPPADRPPPSFFVAVVGDSEAAMLAQGLTEAFADDPRVGVINKAREDTGLVREDFYDWRRAVKELLDGPQHIDLAVIQIGINDNQKLHDGGNVLDPLSKPFNEIYASRVAGDRRRLPRQERAPGLGRPADHAQRIPVERRAGVQ